MLKVIRPTTSCGCDFFLTKCAEIHYQTCSFSILCIFCSVKTLDYAEFVNHFHEVHFGEFTKAMQSTAEPIVTPLYEMRKSHDDPLEFGNTELTTDPEVVTQKLKQEQKGEANKAGFKNLFITSDFDETTRSGNSDEFLNCRVKKEEANVAIQTNVNKLELLGKRNCVVQRNDQTEYRRGDCDIKSDDDNYNKQKYCLNSGEVDWSKPFEPNLLKNHDKRPYKPRNKPNLCTYCGRTFKRRYQLETHLNVHTGRKPHQCEICGRLFRAITTLTRHLNTHEKREALHCRFCRKAFTHKVAVLSHELRHTQERNVPCNECDKLFYTANQMDTHKRKVHNKNDQDGLPFICDICSKSYRTASMLSTHKLRKHYKTAKYLCDLCDKRFVIEEQLTMHKRTHTDCFLI